MFISARYRLASLLRIPWVRGGSQILTVKRPSRDQGVCLLQNYIFRLRQARMVQCGPDGYWSTLKRMENWDERPLDRAARLQAIE